MRRTAIEEQNRYLLEHQRQFRAAADVVCDAWATFSEVQAVAVIGSVARMLWKEVPRFREFRRERVQVWHECNDLDLALARFPAAARRVAPGRRESLAHGL